MILDNNGVGLDIVQVICVDLFCGVNVNLVMLWFLKGCLKLSLMCSFDGWLVLRIFMWLVLILLLLFYVQIEFFFFVVLLKLCFMLGLWVLYGDQVVQWWKLVICGQIVFVGVLMVRLCLIWNVFGLVKVRIRMQVSLVVRMMVMMVMVFSIYGFLNWVKDVCEGLGLIMEL